MTYRDILTHVRSRGSIEPVETAVRLARRFNARLTALYALSDVAQFKRMLGEKAPELRGLVERDSAEAAEAEKRIRALAAREGVEFEWQVGEGDPADLLSIAARLQDLVVIGQCEPGEPLFDNATGVVIGAEQPTLVVPSTGPFLSIGSRIVVAWNGSAQAAAAIRHARPFLAAAEQVVVLVGNEERERFPAVTRRPPLDLAAYLKRHGVPAEFRSFGAKGTDAGPAILTAVDEASADLLVMGAFGRSQLREWILGGATRHVLDCAPIPVLMAH